MFSTRITYILFLFSFIFLSKLKAQTDDRTLDDGVIRILAIGNSFSEDAIENNLFELANARGKKIVIGNLYIGGAPLELHVKNALGDSSAYSYRKVDESGAKSVHEHMKISAALLDEPWDYISFQQASPLSGKYDTYAKDLPLLYAYVKEHVKYPETKYILHQTWAYQHDSDHSGFSLYERNQEQMYKAIVSTSEKVYKWGNFSILIPCGTAIQNARTTYVGDHFTRDGYHLNLNYGRFIAACVWYEALFKEDVRNNAFVPLSISYVESKIAKQAAHHAIIHPYNITLLKDYTFWTY
ncbi:MULTISPECIES: DUF4886 domain-containing protein [unclassified Sphingobacterium]|uniref:DUF4886 domain-containing protein n=1 Tax=unclassified Sphingobacterium TaxID=2609468 RepID=UPI001048606F|nr:MULTISPECIES: DUF4886 domain-containing protein [unclassified Sphingobacterium]MBB2952679.1 hypothetical protein [Sphingobacterium sp. JUb56]MCS3556066.1 hypothetical protein [Sphingobacterium sp. JUb21]TCR00347.1 uncharacterized protein DUF4886 [Sphingobacterium sp. JUb20]